MEVSRLRTARDMAVEGAERAGLEETEFVFELHDGRIVNVASDRHPVLDLPADKVKSVSFKPSAEAGAAMRC